jgi:hypothetical protein
VDRPGVAKAEALSCKSQDRNDKLDLSRTLARRSTDGLAKRLFTFKAVGGYQQGWCHLYFRLKDGYLLGINPEFRCIIDAVAMQKVGAFHVLFFWFGVTGTELRLGR